MRILGDRALRPALDPLNREWFTRGVVVVQVCAGCQAVQHPPEEVCGSCQHRQLGWRECSGEGRIESVAVVHQAVHPAFTESVPYAVVVVSLDDAPGVHAIGNVVNRPPDRDEIGQRVRAVFESVEATEHSEALQIPQWEIVSG